MENFGKTTVFPGGYGRIGVYTHSMSQQNLPIRGYNPPTIIGMSDSIGQLMNVVCLLMEL